MGRQVPLVFLMSVLALPLHSQIVGENIKYITGAPGSVINTTYHESSPVVSPDGQTMYFVRANHPQNRYKNEGSNDLWMSTKQSNGSWGTPVHLPSPINEHHGNQIFTVLPDNKTVFARGGVERDTKGFCFFRVEEGIWLLEAEIEIAGLIQMDEGNFYGATMSSDREHIILYFSEDPAFKLNDLYYSKRTAENKYSRPKKIGGTLNSPKDEFSPFLGPDDKTLYFASTRDNGPMGGADLYVSQRLDDSWTKWSDPEPFPEPINTIEFDGHLSVDTVGTYYLVRETSEGNKSNLNIITIEPKKINILVEGLVTDGEFGDSLFTQVNITNNGQPAAKGVSYKIPGKYSLPLPGPGSYKVSVAKEGYFPKDTTFSFSNVENDTTITFDFVLKRKYEFVAVWGMAYNAKNLEPINGAKVNIQSLKDRSKSFDMETYEGYYERIVEGEGDYLISASADGYMDDNIQTTVSGKRPYHKGHIFLAPIEVGASVVLKNIYFEIGTTDLTEESNFELDKVVSFLNKNSTIVVEISGHTDDQGSNEYNLNLSQGRSESVVAYIASHGIAAERMVAKGYGEEQPRVSNDTWAGKAQNRRVEFKIIAK